MSQIFLLHITSPDSGRASGNALDDLRSRRARLRL
jgi:hypothetical protein